MAAKTPAGIVSHPICLSGREDHVTLTFEDGKTGVLTGKVIYTRGLRSGWYLTGVKLQPIADRRLYPGTGPDESEAASPPPEPQAGPVPHD